MSFRWRLLCAHLLPASPPLCSKSSGSAALLALSWTCLLVRTVFPSRAKRQGDVWNKLVGSSSLESWAALHRVGACSGTFSVQRALGAGDQARGIVQRCVTLVDGHESNIITFIYLNHFVFKHSFPYVWISVLNGLIEWNSCQVFWSLNSLFSSAFFLFVNPHPGIFFH